MKQTIKLEVGSGHPPGGQVDLVPERVLAQGGDEAGQGEDPLRAGAL